MIKQSQIRLALLPVTALVVTACSGDDGTDYCKNHYVFHADHLESTASLNIDISADGDLDGRLTVPRTVVGDMPDSELEQLFSDPERSFTLQSETSCALSLTAIDVTANSLAANYAASCGADNQLGKINVALFDQWADLDEVVVSVVTPATSKHFGISRQCDKPIFRLKKN